MNGANSVHDRLLKRPLRAFLFVLVILTLSFRSLNLSVSSSAAGEAPTSPVDDHARITASVAGVDIADSNPMTSTSTAVVYPPGAVFFNGNPTEPQFLWTHSFSRVLRRLLPANSTRVYATKAREPDKLLEVLPLVQAPQDDLRKLLDKVKKRKVWSSLSLIFSRSSGVRELLQIYPHLFGFCRGPNITDATCPIIVQFPIGQTPCQTCDRKWYTVLPDHLHVKPPSQAIWQASQQLRQLSNNSSSASNQKVDYLSISQQQHSAMENCSIAYVSSWKASKGQLRLAQELVDYAKYYWRQREQQNNTVGHWLLGDGSSNNHNFTICFAGSRHGGDSSPYYQQTIQLLDSIHVRHVEFGQIGLIEQLALFQSARKSVLLTAGDFGPRVVYLSLVAGARVLTTTKAQIAQPVIDNDCLVTEWNLYDTTTSDDDTVAERAGVFESFLKRSDNDCNTFDKAQSILQEDLQYKPLIEGALEQWRRLNYDTDEQGNARRKYECVQLYSDVCAKYFEIMATMKMKQQK